MPSRAGGELGGMSEGDGLGGDVTICDGESGGADVWAGACPSPSPAGGDADGYMVLRRRVRAPANDAWLDRIADWGKVNAFVQ